MTTPPPFAPAAAEPAQPAGPFAPLPPAAAADVEYAAPALVVDGVSVHYPGRATPALADVSLTLAPGERVALVGLNGAGKTTLLRAILGLVPCSGAIAVGGLPLDRQTLAIVRREIGWLGCPADEQLLLPNVLDDVAFGAAARGASPDEARHEARLALEALGIGALAAEAPHALSYGERLRVALAGALVGAPPLLLLDEPTAGLDPPAAERLAALLRTRPSALLVATHDLTLAARMAARPVLIEAGRLRPDIQQISEVVRLWALR